MSQYINKSKLGLTDFEIIMCHDYKEVLKLLLEKIEQAPVADVEKVRHGKWNTFKASSIGCIDIEIPYCSECGMSPLEIGWKYQSPYCPNCGARMDKE